MNVILPPIDLAGFVRDLAIIMCFFSYSFRTDVVAVEKFPSLVHFQIGVDSDKTPFPPDNNLRTYNFPNLKHFFLCDQTYAGDHQVS